MLYIDVKYANLLSNQIDNFKVKKNNPYLVNLRCPLCGDSQKNKKKARGYLYTRNDGMFYKCHNCNVACNFNNFLKQVNNTLYDAYRVEKFTDKTKTTKPEPVIKFEKPKFRERNLLDEYYTKVSKLDKDHPCYLYCIQRQIPEKMFSRLYYIDDFLDIATYYSIDTKNITIKNRLGIPFIDYFGTVNGISCRAIDSSPMRYYVARFNKDPLIYNANNIDSTKNIYVTEGPIDSMFLPNAVSTGNSDLMSISNHYDKDKVILIFDNQPRNKEIRKLMLEAWYQNFSVVVWPSSIKEKDINEMIINGIDAVKTIKKNTFSGPSLRLSITNWNKL